MDVFLVKPRGFCAGVRKALEVVDNTLEEFGAPIYVRHEIVHNKHIINNLKKCGVIFIDDLQEITDTSRPVIFSAHGVAESVKNKAKEMKLITVDATCPLVNSVHNQIKKLEAEDATIIVIGKPTHPEILGTIGQLKNPQSAYIISTLDDAKKLAFDKNSKLGVVTQTTLSVDDTKEIMSYLRETYPNIINSSRINICFATTNRQKAIEHLAQITPNIIIIGSKNSSNSTHLRDAALVYGAQQAWLIDDITDIDVDLLDKCQSIGISAGASAPEYLVDELIKFLKARYDNINIQDVIVVEENISFR